MDIDLAALPDDVATLQQLVRSLAAERTALSAAQSEIERLHLIIKKLQRSQFGGAARWATVASLIATAKLNDVEPFAYLRDVLERMSNGHPMSQFDDLLPWNWTPLKAAA